MKILIALALALSATALLAQPIFQSSYRPPETVQRVAVPVDLKENRQKLLIISGQNRAEIPG